MGRGAMASALFYTLVKTAKSNGLEPYKYVWHLPEKMMINAENIVIGEVAQRGLPKNGDNRNKQR